MKGLFRIFGIIFCVFLALFLSADSYARDFWYYRDGGLSDCRDIEFVFLRGSGQPSQVGDTFKEFKGVMSNIAENIGASYRVTDIDYEAIGISAKNAVGIYISAGKSFSFGRSVQDGVEKLNAYYNRYRDCERTNWVFGGYSQGAMVVANSLDKFNADSIVYIALFGDPKLYLPEGKGIRPSACRGENLSAYRVSVPNCHTDNGILNSRIPYEVSGFEGLFGLWCNNEDFICGSSKNPLKNSGHSLYEETGAIYEASMIVAGKLAKIKAEHYPYLTKSSSGIRLAVEGGNSGSGVYAIASAKDMAIRLGEPISLSAHNSVSLDGSDLSYEWWLNERKIGDGVVLQNYYFSTTGNYDIGLVVKNASGANASTSVHVSVVDELVEKDRLQVPVLKAVQRDDNSFRISWNEAPEGAALFGLKVNGYYLGYSVAEHGELIVQDVDFDDLELTCFWLDENMDMGYEANYEVERLSDNVAAVETSGSGGWRIFAVISLPFLGALALRVANKTWQDLKRIKTPPERKPRERMTRSRHFPRPLGEECPCKRL